MINPERVTEILLDCLYREDEIINGIPTPEPVIVEAITAAIGLHKERLKSHKKEIKSILDQLPDTYQPEKGGGSFLGTCYDKDGLQWGEHKNMQELFILGVASGLAKSPIPREMWMALPGSMPYFCILSLRQQAYGKLLSLYDQDKIINDKELYEQSKKDITSYLLYHTGNHDMLIDWTTEELNNDFEDFLSK